MNMEQTVTAVVPAAGVGRRMGADLPKQYLQLSGKTVLEHTLDRLLGHPLVSRVIVAIGPDDEVFSTLAPASDPAVSWVHGGAERADSVLSALRQVSSEFVLVHDAARPCLAPADLDALLAAGRQADGAILASRVRDTMKRGDGRGGIAETVPRNDLWHALTPQCFPTAPLRQALELAMACGGEVTDEASAMERAGFHPRLVEGRADNIKITRPEDLGLAAFFLQQILESKT